MQIGANYLQNGKTEFVVWAPFLQKVELQLISPQASLIPMEPTAKGYWKALVDAVTPDTKYLYMLEAERHRPDPASAFQPEGVHGPSQVVDHQAFNWQDRNWRGISLSEMIIYELHIGTFTPAGTFDAVIPRLDALVDLGVTAIEIMPVAQFPGERNWGYDGVYLFAVQNSYGGPEGLKRLVNACHQRQLAVILDVVYNHLGPEGNYLWDYGPYFTDKYKTAWGSALNFDDAYSDAVRDFYIENALHWFNHYHIDALRIDAIHGIYDMSAKHILQELAERVEDFSARAKRRFYLIAESDLNDSRVIKPRELGGYGLDAQWNDDFHHCLHTLLTAENQGYYVDFGRVEHLLKSLREGFVYSGQYSQYRNRRHGNSAKARPARQFVIFAQNHDQIGNRMWGTRLSHLVPWEALKLAAGAVIFSPYIPLLFMGEEYGENTPFLYFASHSDPDLIEAVRQGRSEEFKAFKWQGEPPDPEGLETFLKSKLTWEKRKEERPRILLDFYTKLLKLRKELPALSQPNNNNLEVWGSEAEKVVLLRRWSPADSRQVFSLLNFNRADLTLHLEAFGPAGQWQKLIDSAATCWLGPGSVTPPQWDGSQPITIKPLSFVAYVRELIG